MHEDNIFDEMIAKHPEPIAEELDKRYGALTLEPRKLKFIDRIVADSRDVALNHTAGLSLPQQVMMSLSRCPSSWTRRRTTRRPASASCKKRVAGDDRGPGHRSRAEPALRLLLRPDRFRVLGAQVRGRGGRGRG